MSLENNVAGSASAKDVPEGNSYEAVKKIADYILSSTKHRPKVGIICGSGLGPLAEKLVNSDILPYESIPNFPVTSLPEHVGRLVLGLLSGVPVLCMQGRIHFYEGHPMWKCGVYVRVMKLMGIEDLIVTNAAGGITSSYRQGDFMIIRDHINTHNFGGETPLRGLNDLRFGDQYPSMINAYDKILRKKAKQIAAELGIADMLQEGVYSMMTGPMYETPAELKALQILGANAVGMSTVPEVITARHCGIRVFGLSLISNMCDMDDDSEVKTHVELARVGASREKEITQLVSRMVSEMAKTQTSKS